jgi:hypothetical protein
MEWISDPCGGTGDGALVCELTVAQAEIVNNVKADNTRKRVFMKPPFHRCTPFMDISFPVGRKKH